MPLRLTDYNDTILHDISLEIEAGEHLTILGPNGAGKTTLAKVLCGLIPTETATIDGRRIDTMSGADRAEALNYIPAKLDIYDGFVSVEDFLALSRLDERMSIDAALQRLGIAHLKSYRCKTLSSGESQLLLTASALLHGARYTIFDEPTANLDPIRMRTLFALLSDENVLKSKIVITHNLELAYKLGFDILYLEAGCIVFQGSADAFFAQSQLDAIYHGSVKNLGEHVAVALKNEECAMRNEEPKSDE